MGIATNLVMGYKAILYGSSARNNLKTALWKINIVQGANDTESRAGHDVQQKLESPQNRTLVFIPGAYSCRHDSFILAQMHIPQSRAILNCFVKQLRWLHPGPT
jgi:hypothetical protein